MAIGFEQAGDDAARRFGGGKLHRMVIEVGVHEALQRAFVVPHRWGEGGDRARRGAHVLDGLDAQLGDSALCFCDQIIDHRADLRPHQLADQPIRRDLRIARKGSIPAAFDEGQGEQLIEAQQPGAQAIIDIVIVIGDIVRDRRDLRLQRGSFGQRQRKGGISLGQRPAGMPHRAVVLGQPFQRFPCQIEPRPFRIRAFQRHQRAQRMAVVIESARARHRRLQRILPGMAERRMTDIVSKAECFGKILVQSQRASDRAADLGDLQAVRQADAEMIAIGGKENLRLVSQPAETDRMNDSIAIALKGVARAASPFLFFVKTTAAGAWVRGPARQLDAHAI